VILVDRVPKALEVSMVCLVKMEAMVVKVNVHIVLRRERHPAIGYYIDISFMLLNILSK
jgi:hypothetical protein